MARFRGMFVGWIEQQDGESDGDRLQKALGQRGALGLCAGNKHIGRRRPITETTQLRRMWALEGIWKMWDGETVGSVLTEHCQDFCLTYKTFRSGATCFFKATTKPDQQVQHITVEYQDDSGQKRATSLWARVAPPKDSGIKRRNLRDPGLCAHTTRSSRSLKPDTTWTQRSSATTTPTRPRRSEDGSQRSMTLSG